MAVQLILVLESDETSRSDYIYISSILNKWYNINATNDVKISRVFMGGKGNYKKKKVVNTIEKYRKSYKNGTTNIIFCFDTDRFEIDASDRKAITEEQKYCEDNGFEFVWFCHDIEEVFLGESVSKNEKTERARQYAKSNTVERLNKKDFASSRMIKKKSNLVFVLDKYLTC